MQVWVKCGVCRKVWVDCSIFTTLSSFHSLVALLPPFPLILLLPLPTPTRLARVGKYCQRTMFSGVNFATTLDTSLTWSESVSLHHFILC